MLYFLTISCIWEARLLFGLSANFWSFLSPFAVRGEGSELTLMVWSHSIGARQAEQGGGGSRSHQWASNHQAKRKATRAPRSNQERQIIRPQTQKQAQLQHSPNCYWKLRLELEWGSWDHSWRVCEWGSQVRLLKARAAGATWALEAQKSKIRFCVLSTQKHKMRVPGSIGLSAQNSHEVMMALHRFTDGLGSLGSLWQHQGIKLTPAEHQK